MSSKAEGKHGTVYGWSFLHYDVRYGNLAFTQFLIESGAREKWGWTVLHAAPGGEGAAVTEVQTSGWNSIHLALRTAQHHLHTP